MLYMEAMLPRSCIANVIVSFPNRATPAMAATLPPGEYRYPLAHIQQSISTSMIAVNVVLPAVATVFVVLRMLACKMTRASWQANDFVLMAALVRDFHPRHCKHRLLIPGHSAIARCIYPLYRSDPLRPFWHGTPSALHSQAPPERSHRRLKVAIFHRDDLEYMHIPRQTLEHSPFSPHLWRSCISSLSTVSPPRPCLPLPLDNRRLFQRTLSLCAGAESLGHECRG